MIATFSLYPSMAQADEPVSNYEQLKVLEPFVGTWKVRFNMENGKTIRAQVTYEWGKDRNFLVAKWVTEGEKELAGVEVFRWDPATKAVKMWNYVFTGASSEAVWSFQGDKWTAIYRTTLPDGKKGMSVMTLKWSGKDSIMSETIGVEGPVPPKGLTIKKQEFKRVK